ncbi:MAG: MarR family transcriptional regulator [Clostridia bacterium]|nr:MarR family transcriptional regulator [Clostridia bacterium]
MYDSKYDCQLLKNQLCFPLYACSKETIRLYRPFLEPFDLTYTQYLALLVLWEEKKINVKAMGKRLFLDSGTLTPVLKCLENKGYITRQRCPEDERVLDVELTEEGAALQDRMLHIPAELAKCVNLTPEEARSLYALLYKALGVVPDVE